MPRRRDGFAGSRRKRSRCDVVIEFEASVTDGDENQAAAQDGQTSDDDSEETSGNAIKVTHDTPLASNGDGADQLIKTFGIPRGAAMVAPCARPEGSGRAARRRRILEPNQADASSPVLPSKISRFPPDPNHLYIAGVPTRWRGVSRSSRTRGGMRWTRAALLTRGARLADGEAVWS